MNIFICDDDSLIRNELHKLVEKYFISNSYPAPRFFIFGSGEKLIECEVVPDFVFLDIELPGFSGINIGNRLHEKHPNILIFVVTAHPTYLDDAMRFSVFRYLTKPVDVQRLYENLDDAVEIYNNMYAQILIEDDTMSYTVSTNDIIMIETVPAKHKTCIHTASHNYFSSDTIKCWYEKLNNFGSFYQCNRSYIINFQYISSFNEDTVFLLNDTISAFITKRKLNQFRSAYLMYLEHNIHGLNH